MPIDEAVAYVKQVAQTRTPTGRVLAGFIEWAPVKATAVAMVRDAPPGAEGRKRRKLRDEVSSRNIASEEVKSLLRDLMLTGSKDEPGDVGRLASSILAAIEEDEKAKRPVRKPLQYILWNDDPEGVAIALAIDDRFYDYATW